MSVGRWWRRVGQLLVPRELKPPENQPDVRAAAAAGIVSCFSARRCPQHLCALCSVHTSVLLFDLYWQWFSSSGWAGKDLW